MKSLFIRVMLCAAALLIKLNVKAQDQSDYMITMKGDSIPCQINFTISNIAKYTLKGTKNSVKINPDAIKEYYVSRNNITYVSVTPEGDTVSKFMEVLEKGKLNLYLDSYYTTRAGFITTGDGPMMMSNSKNYNLWYISKNGGIAKILKGNGQKESEASKKQRMANFGEMLKDNELVYQKYTKDKKFNNDQIRNLVHWYNTGQQLPPPPPDNY